LFKQNFPSLGIYLMRLKMTVKRVMLMLSRKKMTVKRVMLMLSRKKMIVGIEGSLLQNQT
jgi:hypothetical protein